MFLNPNKKIKVDVSLKLEPKNLVTVFYYILYYYQTLIRKFRRQLPVRGISSNIGNFFMVVKAYKHLNSDEMKGTSKFTVASEAHLQPNQATSNSCSDRTCALSKREIDS